LLDGHLVVESFAHVEVLRTELASLRRTRHAQQLPHETGLAERGRSGGTDA
jgi:hypothetical protein